MPEVLPFRGVRYAASRPGALSRLLAPPYDVISPVHRAELAARSPHNVVHLTLGEDRRGDGPDENRHVRAARLLAEWLAAGVLRQDGSEAFYPLEQSFTGPDGRARVRRGVIGACRLHAYADGVVLPHERTGGAAREDRLELLSRTGANLSPVFGLYDDPSLEGARAVAAAIDAAGEPVADGTTDDGARHRLWRVDAPGPVAALRAALRDRKVIIADGHHRYEAALAYRDRVEAEGGAAAAGGGHRHVMMALCSMADPGVFIYPTHRLLLGHADLDLPALLAGLERFFDVHTLVEDLRRPAGRAWAVAKLAEHSGKSTTFLMVSARDGKGRILTLRDDAPLSEVALPASSTLRDLDVTALHGIVLQHLLRVSSAEEHGGGVRYELDAGEVVTRTLGGEAALGFLLNPTPMWQVQAVAESGERMPQKSTYFSPKIASGLVLRRLREEPSTA